LLTYTKVLIASKLIGSICTLIYSSVKVGALEFGHIIFTCRIRYHCACCFTDWGWAGNIKFSY